MLKISTVDSSKQRKLVLEGALVAPWAAELSRACEMARAGLDGRQLVVDVKNLMAVSPEGENILLALMNDGVQLRCHGVYAKQVLRQIARRNRKNFQETKR